MNILIDKLIIFMLCIVFYIPNVTSNQRIVPILTVIIISAAFSYLENFTFKIAGLIAFVVISIYNPVFIFFVPLIFYDTIFVKIKWVWVIALLPVLFDYQHTPFITILLVLSFIVIAVLLKYRTISLKKIVDRYYELQDNSKEMALLLEIKNKELMEKQDYEINLATLNERNRIARDIHDNVGHLLSSSILQIGALLAVSKDIKMKDSLRLVNGTLSQAMDSIRNSVHDLHEESIDLQNEVNTLMDQFAFCPITLAYSIQSNPDKKLKYCFISVIKEALSNIIKHSNATEVTVILREHPALYQLVVQDNGTKIRKDGNDNGIGLKNISDRVAAFQGNFNVSLDNGFRIFISIPKI